MTKQAAFSEQLNHPYKEESVKPAIIITLVIVAAIAFPLGWMVYKIGDKGFRENDIARYTALAQLVETNVEGIRKILVNDVVDERVLSGVAVAPMVTLITPNIIPTNQGEAANNNAKSLNVELKAIYWNPREPLVTLGDENYTVGEKVQGFTITEIRKTEVVFRSPLGESVIKYFYDYLDTPKRK